MNNFLVASLIQAIFSTKNKYNIYSDNFTNENFLGTSYNKFFSCK